MKGWIKLGILVIFIAIIYSLIKKYPEETVLISGISLLLLVGYWIANLQDEK